VLIRIFSWLSAIFWIGLGTIFALRMPHMAEGLSFTSPDGLTGLRAIVSRPAHRYRNSCPLLCFEWAGSAYLCQRALRADSQRFDCLEWGWTTRLRGHKFAT
jgi:hypothetical protein